MINPLLFKSEAAIPLVRYLPQKTKATPFVIMLCLSMEDVNWV